MPGYVLDASIGIKWFVTKDPADQAVELLAQIGAVPPTRFVVPDLFYVECANILWKHVRRFGYSESRAREDLALLGELALESYPTAALVNDALAIALEYGASVYDSCYVALGEQLGLPIITADKRLVSKFIDTDHRVLWLGSLALDAGMGE